MSDAAAPRPSLLSHVSVGVSDLDRAGRFYDAVMATLGARRVIEHAVGVGYGVGFPEFWTNRPIDGQAPSVGNGTHVCFNAADEASVRAFHAAGLDNGGSEDGAPGLRPEYAPRYFAAFLRDPDGNKVEAMCWLPETGE